MKNLKMTNPEDSNIISQTSHKRRLFCEVSPFCYWISSWKCCFLRWTKDVFGGMTFARNHSGNLPNLIYRHQSLIRRKLGNVNPELQENKSVNLALAAPRIDGVVIHPGEVFSLWKLVGRTSAGKGYKTGLMIKRGVPSEGIGGGLCQLSNLIHWLVLHSPLEVIEHHHHDGIDMFPDFGRQVPFGVGTSITYNYLDYRFRNPTEQSFQLRIWTDSTHLRGELRSEYPLKEKYHIVCEKEFFSREKDGFIYRNNEIYRYCVNKSTGQFSQRVLLKKNHARILYDESFVHGTVVEETT